MSNSLDSANVLEALVSNDRSKLSKTFGVGLFVSDGETPEQVIAKCKTYIGRYETYIANLNVVINSGEALASEIKASNLISSLSEDEKEALKGLLGF
ncbi:hypothetical protein C799_00741 [Bacteroides thetaiotaomicron dnLKV9]|jgi:hypothetical protein|uniref:Uncharacterized protein n=1 Tax=Bacteroides thetaiotaomicron dnLKV9 TaxID=1235785 RepID=R9HFL7_BACT4|nr:hypothetical protein [Bacteroides thetaiotaomicron]EOS02689.1 hypothetical protein C799_00741 [Bacteroides thetaiotaomicron dnLKV9]MCS2955015.1 hypothetical protein [Bacteroides thetaiotaomicron]